MTDPISWTTARSIAAKVAGREPFSSSYLASSIETDFIELTQEAEKFVERATGLEANGSARVRVTDRKTWASANIALFRRFLLPLTDKMNGDANRRSSRLGSQVTGAQLGLVLGWMSTRVLGQYDLLLNEDDHPEEQDIVYYVSPNILSLEKRYAFPPREFRLWIALHECTHRAQFTGVPWLTSYFREHVQSLLDEVDTDPKHLAEAVKQMARSRDKASNGGGLLTFLASEEQQATLNRITGLMSLLEGHADVTMSRAAQEFIPGAERFHRVLHRRRANATGFVKIMQRLLGMEAKLRQYAEGETFVKSVESAGGRELFDRVWEDPSHLPTLDEIRDPDAWIARMQHAAQPA